MTNPEHTIAIDAANEGMVLSHDLLDAGGAVLLPAGASLSAASLSSLRRRGIEQLQVVPQAPPPDPAALAAERERQTKRLADLFRHSASCGATARLLEQMITYRNGA
jgi:hypothetical protein